MTQDRHASAQGAPSGADTGSMLGQDPLARRLSELARELQQQHDMQATLEHMVNSAVAMVPGADEGSISVVTGCKHVGSQVPTGDLPTRVDAIQNEAGQGPCLDALFKHQTVRVNDLRHADRWPAFAARAAEAGALSMLSFQLYVEGGNLGALNLFSRHANAFDDESEHVGLLFASHAAVAFADMRKQDQLQDAMDTRDLIGQGKGILIERFKVRPEQAFLMMVKVSQDTNTKLRDVAAELVRSGLLDPHDSVIWR